MIQLYMDWTWLVFIVIRTIREITYNVTTPVENEILERVRSRVLELIKSGESIDDPRALVRALTRNIAADVYRERAACSAPPTVRRRRRSASTTTSRHQAV